jgi:tRNA pseudouridine38-40 synthase
LFTYKLNISYDGTRYHGWQVQPNADTIQQTIQDILSQIVNQRCYIVGSGRTDAGVHALNQIAHFRINKQLNVHKLQKSFNALLPKDIRVESILFVPNTFHARYSAIAKRYRYYIKTGPVISPFDRNYYYHYKPELNLERLQKASQHFIGTYDFSTFANEANKGSAAKNATKTIYSIEIQQFQDKIIIDFYGNGFLYKMVRNIVGTLIAAASTKISIAAIPELMHAKDRRLAPNSAPAHGLFLMAVEYEPIYEKNLCLMKSPP